MKLNTVQCGDCLEVIKTIPDHTFDMSFADPPFNLDKNYAKYKDNRAVEDYLEWCEKWIMEMVRVTKPSGTLLLHNIPKWLAAYGCMLESESCDFRHWIAWDAPTSPMGKSLQPAHYGILYYAIDSNQCKINELRMPHKRCRSKQCNLLLKDYGGKKQTIHPFGPLVSDVWSDIHRGKHTPIDDKIHPCSLPVHLMERLVLMCTDEGDTVFDCFAGTGTSLVAAKRLGRKYFGIELSQVYVDHCEKQLAKQPKSQIGGIWASCYLNRFHTVRDCDIMEGKDFNPKWKALFENWPDTDEKRMQLNVADLEFASDVKKQIKQICFDAEKPKLKRKAKEKLSVRGLISNKMKQRILEQKLQKGIE